MISIECLFPSPLSLSCYRMERWSESIHSMICRYKGTLTGKEIRARAGNNDTIKLFVLFKLRSMLEAQINSTP
eukprot:gene8494-5962_t